MSDKKKRPSDSDVAEESESFSENSSEVDRTVSDDNSGRITRERSHGNRPPPKKTEGDE